jgi:anti-anti-sigma regulatory factor
MEIRAAFPHDWSIAYAEEVRQYLLASLESKGEIVWDFSAVQVCDTAGVQLICAALRTARLVGRRVRIVAVSAVIKDAAGALGVTIEGVDSGV